MIPNPTNLTRIAVQLTSLVPLATRLEAVLSDPDVHLHLERLRVELRELSDSFRIPEVDEASIELSRIRRLLHATADLFPHRDWSSWKSPLSDADSRLSPVETRFRYRNLDCEWKPMRILEPDPPVLGRMDDYRIGERAALLLGLQRSPEVKLFLVPGFSGVGKSANLVPSIRRAMDAEKWEVEYLPVCDALVPKGELRRRLKEIARRSHDRLLVVTDDTPMVVEETIAEVRDALPEILGAGARAVLVGGAFHSTDDQERLLFEHYGSLISPDSVWSVPVHVKPLNRMQATEVLSSEATRLSSEAYNTFAGFALGYLPPFLRVLRPFRIAPEIDSLRGALDCFCTEYKKSIAEILEWRLTIPEGGTEDDVLSREVEDLIRGIDEEADRFFTRFSRNLSGSRPTL